MKSSTLVAALFTVFASALQAADPLPRATPESVGMSSERLARLTAALQADVARGKIPGAVVAIARNGKLVYFEAFGYLDPQTKTPMPKDAIFSIASMTKPMASVALMQLFEEGRVLVSDPVGKHLPMLANMRVAPNHDNPAETVAAVRPMTVQDILRHTSGIVYGGRGATALHKMYPPASSWSGTNLTSEEFLAKLASVPLAHQPGTVWDYSLSTDVVGLTVEALHGKPLGKVLHERIWTPLGMADTGFSIPAEKQNRYAGWFANDPETGKPQFVLDLRKPLKMECGGGCAASTAADYVRFAQMLLGKGTLEKSRILSKKTVEYMTTDHLGPEVNNRMGALSASLNGYGFGLGFAVRRGDGVSPMIGGGGEYLWSGAYGTYFWVDPKEQLVVVLMSHTPGVYRATLRPMVGALVYQAINI